MLVMLAMVRLAMMVMLRQMTMAVRRATMRTMTMRLVRHGPALMCVQCGCRSTTTYDDTHEYACGRVGVYDGAYQCVALATGTTWRRTPGGSTVDLGS